MTAAIIAWMIAGAFVLDVVWQVACSLARKD